MTSSSRIIVSPEEALSILREILDGQWQSNIALRSFDDLFCAAMLLASARGNSFTAITESAVCGDDTPITVSSLWDMPDQMGALLACALPLVDESPADNERTRRDIGRIIADDLRSLVSPTIFDFSRRYGPKSFTSVSAFFEDYPVLASRVIHLVSCLAEFFTELFERFHNDRDELELKFRTSYRHFSSVKMLPSDPHNGQRRSVVLEFVDSQKLVYKPRSLAGESHFVNILEIVRNFGIHLPEPQILDQGTHGWMKWVAAPANPPSGDEVALQIGSLLALASTIALIDLHAENVLLSEEGIVVIDAEAIGLFSPDMRRRVRFLRPPNVLDLGILPQATGTSRSNWWDGSLCGITPGRQTVPAGLNYVGPNDARHPVVVYHRIEAEHASVRAAISGLDTHRLISLVTQGFEHTSSILSHLDPILAEPGLRSNFRYIHRPTAAYYRTLLRMTDAACGTSAPALVREVIPYTSELQEQLTVYSIPATMPIVAEELAALIHGDIPRLTAQHLDSSFPEANQIRIWTMLPRSDSARLIEMSLRLRFERIEMTSEVSMERTQACVTTTDDGLTCIKEIADAAKSNFIVARDPDGVTHILGVAPHAHSGIPEITKLGDSVYDGAAGILFVLGLANTFGGSGDYSDVVQALVEVLKHGFESTGRLRAPSPSSLASGPIGVLYVASLLYRISKSGTTLSLYWARQLQEFVAYLDKGVLDIPADCADVLTGLSGWLLILDSLPVELMSHQVRRLQEYVIRQILDLQQETGAWPSLGKPEMCGFSHGAAGIRYALGRVLVRGFGPEQAIVKAMRSAADFEQRSFAPTVSNWRDYRLDVEDPKAYSTFSAWCHGAAGIALAEAGLARIGLPILSERIGAVFARPEPLMPNRRSLCCGPAAYLELLRLLKKNNQLALGLRRDTSEENENSQERDAPLGLFRADYGTRLLSAMVAHKPDLPCLLLFE